jgi:hypothetical protein
MAVTTTLKDAAYVTVGLGVLGFQKAQVRRVELMKQVEEATKQLRSTGATRPDPSKVLGALEAQVVDAAHTVRELAKDIDARIVPVREQVQGRLDAIEGQLPSQVRDLVKQARIAALDTEGQVRSRLGLAAAPA